jgi:hypothetical protein
MREVILSEIMDSPPTNSGLKKKDISQKKTGEFSIPVYSATQKENLVFGWTSENSKWRKYKNVLTWNKDGSAGVVFYRKDKFVPYEKVKVLVVKEKISDLLFYPFLKYVIQERMGLEGFNFNLKCSMDRVMMLDIRIPVKPNGEFDIEKQMEIAKKYEAIEQIKNKLKKEYDEFYSLNVRVDMGADVKIVNLLDVFDLKKGSSKYTLSFINSNSGSYPIYSSNTKNSGLFGMANSFDYDLECIQITTNGANAGTIFYRPKHKFGINADAKLLVKKNKNLDYKFLLYILREKFSEYGFNWENKASDDKLSEISFEIPVKPNGEFDIEKQMEIAKKYEAIEQIKNKLKKEYERTFSSKIEIMGVLE